MVYYPRGPQLELTAARAVRLPSEQTVCRSEQLACWSEQTVCWSEQLACWSEQLAYRSEQSGCRSEQSGCQSEQSGYWSKLTERLDAYLAQPSAPSAAATSIITTRTPPQQHPLRLSSPGTIYYLNSP
ncbi:hypothetical protein PtB15_2B850 [Puccinia triticina]|nr:hypothetical protein PtB15_2B850 [Puccinia triticina]